MYSIGMFSQIGRVTTKALRHYDELGLLKPACIDRFTGYRYYTSEQLTRLHQILALKQMGFTLTEVSVLLNTGCPEETILRLLEQKRREVSSVICREQDKLNRIESFLKAGKGFFMNNYTVSVKELPGAVAASLRRMISGFDMLSHLYPEVIKPELTRLGCKCTEPSYCFNIYHDGEYREHDIDVEICQAVTEKKADSELLTFKEIPAIPQAACVLHKGAYARLGDAYASVIKWIEDNGYEITGCPREVYIDGNWNQDNVDHWLTEIQFPVKKA
ncbi:MerR family transcriptional regulator [Clostridium sp. D33t1_170424_F3]|uniref:MerR family transcriptional regulator n=1 Tax=Clostridium sp. D33t1_170424_F3 TaxID=2787099 RepID=UPI0018ABCE71|nr:MerR family transcriptional regulator [Clostridium sp. D33t1_170424_F3]